MDANLKKNIAIQGIKGSFHEIAALIHLNKTPVQMVSYNTFNELIDSVENLTNDFGLIAIENTVAGSLLPNYSLLEGRNLKVTGEILLRIEQNLLALNGQSIEDIKEGEKFTEQNIWVKRPGTGEIRAEGYKDVLGKISNRDIKINTQIKKSDIR